MPLAYAEKAITGQNQYSSTISVVRGYFNILVRDTSTVPPFVANVNVERSIDGGTTWDVVETHTAAIVRVGQEAEGALFRIGVPTGGYTSGSIFVRIGC